MPHYIMKLFGLFIFWHIGEATFNDKTKNRKDPYVSIKETNLRYFKEQDLI